MISKEGSMTTKEVLEIVLGGAIVLLLIILLYNLISPTFDREDEIMKSYFESFEEQIIIADSEGVGSFSIWQLSDKGEDIRYFLVYFGNGSSQEGPTRSFYSLRDNTNHICICSWEDGVDRCNYCKNLDLPVVRRMNVGETWAVGVGVDLDIKKEEGYYDFRRVL